MNWEEFLKEAAARADKNSRDDWTNVEGSNEPFSSLSCNPFSPERFFLPGPLRSYWLPVLLLQCNEKRLRYFFFPLPLSSVDLRRVYNFQEESSLLRLYTRFHTKSLISLIFSEKNIYIYTFQQRDDKKRKKGKKERNFSKNLIEVNELFLYFAKDKNIHW